jgi:glutaredoxin
MGSEIVIFSIESCPHCAKAKSLFKSKNWEFVNISLTDYPEKRKDMLTLTHRLTVPQIFFNTKHVGGNSDLEELEREGKLDILYADSMKENRFEPLLKKPTGPPKPAPSLSPRTNNHIEIQGAIFSFGSISVILKNELTFQSSWSLLKNRVPFSTGNNLIDFLKSKYELPDAEAIDITKRLIHWGIIQPADVGLEFCKESKFSLHIDVHPFILNGFSKWNDRLDDSMAVLKSLKVTLGKILSKHRNEDGLVDYLNARVDPDFLDFEESSRELQIVDWTTMSIPTRKAFFVNLYNLIVLHTMVKVGAPTNSISRLKYFDMIGYNVGNHVFSMSDVEHGILRENSAAPFHFSKQFSPSDDRLPLLVTKDPRIHFALNCGARSCPPIKSFTAEGIEEELMIVTEAFLEQEDHCRVDLEKKMLCLSKIFDWYKIDFGSTPDQVARFILQFLRGEKKEQLTILLKSSFQIQYENYDWSNDSSNILVFNFCGD